MKLVDMERLWPLARVIHETRRDLAWGPLAGQRREPFPAFSSTYTHNPIAYVDLALASAEAAERFLKTGENDV